jgi:hypothetical protein
MSDTETETLNNHYFESIFYFSFSVIKSCYRGHFFSQNNFSLFNEFLTGNLLTFKGVIIKRYISTLVRMTRFWNVKTIFHKCFEKVMNGLLDIFLLKFTVPNYVIIIQTNVLLPKALVTLADFGDPV